MFCSDDFKKMNASHPYNWPNYNWSKTQTPPKRLKFSFRSSFGRNLKNGSQLLELSGVGHWSLVKCEHEYKVWSRDVGGVGRGGSVPILLWSRM